MMGDLPHITNASHVHTLYDGSGSLSTAGSLGQGGSVFGRDFDLTGGLRDLGITQTLANHIHIKETTVPGRRLIKVVIIDPDDRVPLEDCVLYSGEEKLTDATDQELFFDIDIKDLLADHNEVRVQIVDKKVKERTEYLEPIKVRDLRMVVVDIAKF